MKKQVSELFFYLASYSPWGGAPDYPTRLFRAFGTDLLPQKFDDEDPPRRPYSGGVEDVQFWLAKGEQEWGRWLHFRHKSKDHSFEAVLDWVDRELEPMKARGDYHSMFMVVKTKRPEQIVAFWQAACSSLHPFHAFLDTKEKYNRRAHSVSVDGQVSKSSGWYMKRLPGFFAYNYYGAVYLRRWSEKVKKLPASLIAAEANGLFITAPSGLDLEGRTSEVYSADDLAIIQTLGPEWFHLPGQPDRVYSPTLEEFLAATPQPPTNG